MSGLLLLVRDWRVYISALAMFGFVPGFLLRLVLLLYPPQDERRAELLAELYSLPRWVRPMWVTEQLETALWEGPRQRWRNRAQERATKADAAEKDDPADALTAAIRLGGDYRQLQRNAEQAKRRHLRALMRARRWAWLDSAWSRRRRNEARARATEVDRALRALREHETRVRVLLHEGPPDQQVST